MDILKLLNIKDKKQILEIRIRINSPIIIYIFEDGNIKEKFLTGNGELRTDYSNSFFVTENYLTNFINVVLKNSMYTYKDELTKGFFTLKEGYRIGVAGEIFKDRNNNLNYKKITSINIRCHNEIIGISKEILPYIVKSKKEIFNTLIIAPPMTGKTTLIRDLANNLSEGNLLINPLNISVIDERSEIYPLNDNIKNRGMRVDVISNLNKVVGTEMLIRAMNPNVIILDEIGYMDDFIALNKMIASGVKFVATMHGNSKLDAINRFGEKINIFEKFIILEKSEDSSNDFFKFKVED